MCSARANGFTLLEMLAVILLIGIAVAAVSISVTQGLASARARAASAEVAAALRATRTQAIVHAHEQHFDVDTRANTYSGAFRANVALPKGMRASITSAAEDAPNDHTGRITLRAGERQWHVNVSWLTGEVRVVDTAAAQ